MQNNTKTGSFRFVDESEREARAVSPVKKSSVAKNKLVRNIAVLSVLAFGIWGISAMENSRLEKKGTEVYTAAGSSLIGDEDLGQLKFVSSDGAVMPVDGEVVTTFSDSGDKVELMGDKQANVRSILSGTVAKVSDDELIIQNDNGTRSIYKGVKSSVGAGEYVEKSQVVGTLSEQILSLETVSAIGYVDPLDAKELEQTAV